VAEVDGVRFVDNSKATNPHAALAAVGAADGVLLIAGGDAKGVDLSPLGALAPRLAAVVALGASAGEVVAIFEELVPVRAAGSIEEAVSLAFEAAPPGGTVLLAPACASWDMFRDYQERGERFAAAARALRKEGART
jgi:UDP-N-acetylmuramoylalanine--D-glutamate ligase